MPPGVRLGIGVRAGPEYMAVRLVEAHCNAAGNREKGRRRKWLRPADGDYGAGAGRARVC